MKCLHPSQSAVGGTGDQPLVVPLVERLYERAANCPGLIVAGKSVYHLGELEVPAASGRIVDLDNQSVGLSNIVLIDDEANSTERNVPNDGTVSCLPNESRKE